VAEVSADNIMLSASGVEESSTAVPAGALRVHPNPTRGSTRVSCSVPSGSVTWRICDATGRTVLGPRREPRASSFLLDLRPLPAGVYVLQVSGATSRTAVINRLAD
jgi:hypothetical protein